MFAVLAKLPVFAVLFTQIPITASKVDWGDIFNAVDWNGLATGWTEALPFIAVPLGINYTARNVWRTGKKGMRQIGKGGA